MPSRADPSAHGCKFLGEVNSLLEPGTVELRPATLADLRAVAAIHKRAFAGFFMTELGETFLARYYRLVLEYLDGLLWVAEVDGLPVGFVAGFVRPAGFYRLMRRRAFELGLAALPVLLRRPSIIWRLAANARRTGDASDVEGNVLSELASVAVDPAYAGKGIGARLVRAFIEASRARGADVVYLTTDAQNNAAVNRFYQGLGFRLSRTFWAAGRRLMNEYRLALPGGCE